MQLPKPPYQISLYTSCKSKKGTIFDISRHVKRGFVRYNELLLIFFEKENIMDFKNVVKGISLTGKILVTFDLITYVVSGMARREVSMHNLPPP